MASHTGILVLAAALLGSLRRVDAADCKVVTVASGNTCDSIRIAAGITLAQLMSFNPGLNCAALQVGQKLCVSTGTIPGQPQQNPDGSCSVYTVVSGDSCSALASRFSISVANIETWNAKTWKWTDCAGLQIGEKICVSTGTPPPIPIDPNQQCGLQTVGNVTCPLKACCSAFGFCGLTSEFCITTGTNPCQSNCFIPTLPSCSASRTLRKIGYYAGWGNKRVAGCNPVSPNQLVLTGFTHVHYAFATISQSFQIQISDDDTTPLQGLVKRKSDISGLKVLIAVGGWDFSELDGTKDLFTLMISTSQNRATFISSVAKFLTQFGLDGIDIDFEYPAAIERNGPATDTPNLTSFFVELKAGLPSSALVTLATPAGYWFLRGFQIDKIVPSVSYINMMSYDYHGQWDTNVTGQASVTNPHTSLLDMKDSVLLYTRAGIDMAKVNLGNIFPPPLGKQLKRLPGLAQYARTYHLSSPACKGYNCTMTGGGAKGPCTDSSGILAQFEIDRLVSAGNKPILDTDTQTYFFDTSGGDLITFDQKDTLDKKSNFAATTCFGGTFVWSLDQPTVTITTPPPTKTYADPVTCTSAFAVAKKRMDAMMTYFVPPPGEGGFFVSEPDDQQRLWTDANKWETIYNYMGISGDHDYDIWNQNQLFPTPNGGSGPNWNNLFTDIGSPSSYDDALWTSIMYFKVGDFKNNDQDFYKFGAGILAYVKDNALDTISDCNKGSGVWWNSDRTFKNTVTNGLFLLANGLAFERLNDGKYKQDALDTWGWLSQSGLRGDNGLWRDGIHWDKTTKGCGIDGGIYTYNQGTIPAGLALLHKITGGTDNDYLSDAEITLNAVLNSNTEVTNNGILREPICDPAPRCNDDRKNGPDRMIFKGLFMKHLMYYIDITKGVGAGNIHSGPFVTAIWKQFAAVTSADLTDDDETGDPWFPSDNRYFNGYTDQAGIDAILTAILYGRCGAS